MIINSGYFYNDGSNDNFSIRTNGPWDIYIDIVTRNTPIKLKVNHPIHSIPKAFPFIDNYDVSDEFMIRTRLHKFKITSIHPLFKENETSITDMPSGTHQQRLKIISELRKKDISLSALRHENGTTYIAYDFSWLTSQLESNPNTQHIFKPYLMIMLRADDIERIHTTYYKATYDNKKICLGIPKLKP